jgi:hypothetical protein
MSNPTITAEQYRKGARECDIQKACTDLLTLIGFPWGVTDASRVWAKDGTVRRSKVTRSFPDVSSVMALREMFGRALYLETKTATGGFQPGQREKHEELRAAGAVVIVPRSLSDLARELLDLGVEHQALRKLVR